MAGIAKPLDQIAADDLKALIGEPESQHLLFRREPYGSDDQGRREMLRDISAFANATGGHIVIGAGADNRGLLASLDGIENGGGQVERMLSAAASGIDEPIPGLGAAAFDVREGRQAVVVSVPESTSAPHMVSGQGCQGFWRRYGPARTRMSAPELRAAFLATGNLAQRVDQLHNQRRDVFLNAHSGAPWFRIACAPLAEPREFVDVSDGNISALLMSRRWGADLASSWGMTDVAGKPGGQMPESRPSMEGLAAELPDGRHQEITRTGFVEFHAPVAAFDLRKERAFLEGLTANPRALCEFTIDFMQLVRDLGERAQITVPAVVRVGIFGAREVSFYPFPQGYSGPTQTNRWRDSEHLEIGRPPIARPFDPLTAAREMLDRVWNAFGHAGCPFFDVRAHYIFAA